MEVKPILLTEFSEYGKNHDCAFFGSSDWMKLHGDSILPLGIFRKNKIIGSLLLFKYYKWGKEFVIHPPLAPHCGLQVELSAEKISTQQGQIKRALNALANYLSEEFHRSYIDICLPSEFQDAQPFQWKKFEVSPRYTYLLDLKKTQEELLAEMTTERRKNIKQALQRQYKIEVNQDVSKVLDLLKITVQKANLPDNSKVLNTLLEFEERNRYSLLLHDNNTPTAANVVVYDKSVAYYLAGGHDPSKSDSSAGTFALWSSILKAKELGCETFDFLGSSVPEIEKYFRGFGAELVSYPRVRRAKGLVGWLKKQKEAAG